MTPKVTTIRIFGKYEMTCQPELDPELGDRNVNDVAAYIGITENLKSRLLTNIPKKYYSQQDIQDWLDKFPKSIK
jgi:cytochrome c